MCYIRYLHPGSDEAEWVCHQLCGGGAEHAGPHQQEGGRRQAVRHCDVVPQDAKRCNVDPFIEQCPITTWVPENGRDSGVRHCQGQRHLQWCSV